MNKRIEHNNGRYKIYTRVGAMSQFRSKLMIANEQEGEGLFRIELYVIPLLLDTYLTECVIQQVFSFGLLTIMSIKYVIKSEIAVCNLRDYNYSFFI